MLSNEQVILFCERTKLLTKKPDRKTLIEAMDLSSEFGLFIREGMMSGMNFDSCEDFFHCYQEYANGLNGKRFS